MRTVCALGMVILSCGGESGREHRDVDRPEDDASPRDSTPAAPTAEPAEQRTDPPAEPDAQTSEQDCGSPEQVDDCVDCQDPKVTSLPSCVAGRWACPETLFFRHVCAGLNCESDIRRCCSATGLVELQYCLDAQLGDCNPGTVALDDGEPCAPEGIRVQSCLELDATACDSVELECHDDGRCSPRCTCEPSDDAGGELRWFCLTPAC